MIKLPITVVIAVRNEALNLRKCLESLQPAEQVIVVDSNSEDGTPDIARELGAEVVQFNYTGGYPKKRQWVLDGNYISNKWVFMVDADEVVPEALWEEIGSQVNGPRPSDAYLIYKGFHFMARRFRFGGFSHPAVLLWETGKGRFEETLAIDENKQDMEVHERVLVDGTSSYLKTHLIHEDFKGLEAYLERHRKYAIWEAALRRNFLNTGKWGESDIQPKLFGNSQEFRRFIKKFIIMMPFEAWIWFIYHYLLKLGFLEGKPGWVASKIRCNYIRQVRALVNGSEKSYL